MNRIFLFILILCFIGHRSAFSASVPMAQPSIKSPITSPTQPQKVDFASCNKFFKVDSQKLFYLTLAGINANRFEINEIQSKSGYIIFTAAKKQYLAGIIKIDSENSMLKITPCNNAYYFPIGIIQNMFKYIELNTNTPIQELKKI